MYASADSSVLNPVSRRRMLIIPAKMFFDLFQVILLYGQNVLRIVTDDGPLTVSKMYTY